MDSTIKIKFTIASAEGVELLQKLTAQRFLELHQNQIQPSSITDFVTEKYSAEFIITELNDFTNQFLVVYVDDQPAGYALLKEKGEVPQQLTDKKIGYLRNFEILDRYNLTNAGQILLDKCHSVFKSFDAIVAVTKTENSAMQSLLRNRGFDKHSDSSFFIDTNEIPAEMLVLNLR